jgi:hypothetical protein
MEAVIQRIPSRLFALSAVLVSLIGCAVAPPVQEMSDARQAIRAAQDAQAGKHAAGILSQAEELLSHAARSLEQGAYEDARRAALAARQKAIAARDHAVESGADREM